MLAMGLASGESGARFFKAAKMRIRNSPYIIALRHTPDESCEIGTDRFLVQTLTAEQLSNDVFEWLNDKDVRRFVSLPPGEIGTVEATKLIQNHDNNRSFLFWVTPQDERDRQIGFVQLQINPIHQIAAVGICMGDQGWKDKGAVSEARSAVNDFAFRKLSIQKLTATCQQGDAEGLWSMHSEGWVREGVLREHFATPNGRIDIIQYALFRDDWIRKIDDWAAKRDAKEGGSE
ncbi:MAG: GNAT family protein [Pseudomonadota bacterium]